MPSSKLADGGTVHYQLEVDGSPSAVATSTLAVTAGSLTAAVNNISPTAQLGARQLQVKWYSSVSPTPATLLAVSSVLNVKVSTVIMHRPGCG